MPLRAPALDSFRFACAGAALATLVGCNSGPAPADADFPGGSFAEQRAARSWSEGPSGKDASPASGASERGGGPVAPGPALAAAAIRKAADSGNGVEVNDGAVGNTASLGGSGAGGDGASAVAVNDDPGRLLGLDQRGLESLLGAPGFVRRDNPAQLWRYRHATCVLDLFLYADPPVGSASFRVRHVEVRAAGNDAASPRGCLRTLLVERKGKTTG